jgi:hypothetical protein
MAELRFSLIGEGSTDEALRPIIAWLLREHLTSVHVIGTWANRDQAPLPKAHGLAERIVRAVESVPCDILFVHRDADTAGRTARIAEIERAVKAAQAVIPLPPVVPLVPVRETEAWLLFNEPAIRWGASNPNGRVNLALPPLNQIETITDPKAKFQSLLRAACELRGRRRDRLNIDPRRVADRIDGFAPLRRLPAFQAFEGDVMRVIHEQGWPGTLPDQP